MVATAIAIWAAAPRTASAQDCTGDCSANRTVTIDELVRCVSIALGTIAVDVCPACDSDGDGRVAIQELIQSVRAALGQAVLESNGRCLEPGPTGLQPCAQGTSVRVTRCDDLAICLSPAGGDGLPSGTLDADGRFTDTSRLKPGGELGGAVQRPDRRHHHPSRHGFLTAGAAATAGVAMRR
jgi:hypothetical protein